MIKRLSTAAIGVALVLSFNPAQAAPYFGFDGRNYGELAKAPDFGRPKLSAQRPGDDREAPRKCLKREVHALLDKIEAQFGPVRVISPAVLAHALPDRGASRVTPAAMPSTSTRATARGRSSTGSSPTTRAAGR